MVAFGIKLPPFGGGKKPGGKKRSGGGRIIPPTWKFPDLKKRDADGYYPIVCPYCLDTFHIWEAEFRSVAPYMNAGADINIGNVQNRPVQQNENWGRRANRNQADSENEQYQFNNVNNNIGNIQSAAGDNGGFPLEMDEKYDEFEKRFGGQQNATSRGKVLRIFDEYGNPTGEVTHITLMDTQKGGNDEDNLIVPIEGRKARDFEHRPIMSVINKYGQLCKERICPHCHHRVSNYVGIWPNYTVALIGDTKVGKTVYLHKLGAALSTYGILDGTLIGSEANPDYKSWIRSAMEMDERAQENQPMMGLTTIQFMPPNIIDFKNTQKGGGFILNLFDFPGEALSKPIKNDDGSMDQFKSHYLPKIDRMDAWMLLFDAPGFQTVFTVFQSDEELRPYVAERLNSVTPIEILNYFENEYLASHRNRFIKPLAVIVSKSDLIKVARDKNIDYFPDLPQDQRFLDPNPNINRDKMKVDLDDINQCAAEMEAFFKGSRDEGLLKRITTDQENGEYCWFAVSSKGDATNAVADPVRVTEPMEWILWRLGLVQGVGNNIPGGGNPDKVNY